MKTCKLFLLKLWQWQGIRKASAKCLDVFLLPHNVCRHVHQLVPILSTNTGDATCPRLFCGKAHSVAEQCVCLPLLAYAGAIRTKLTLRGLPSSLYRHVAWGREFHQSFFFSNRSCRTTKRGILPLPSACQNDRAVFGSHLSRELPRATDRLTAHPHCPVPDSQPTCTVHCPLPSAGEVAQRTHRMLSAPHRCPT